MVAILFSWGNSIAEEPALVKKASRLSLRKTNAAALPTYESMMFTDISISEEVDSVYIPTLCLAVDQGAHHLMMEDQVELVGLQQGHRILATVESLEPEEPGNLCSGHSMMVTTDLSDLNGMKNDLYTGSLNITISTE